MKFQIRLLKLMKIVPNEHLYPVYRTRQADSALGVWEVPSKLGAVTRNVTVDTAEVGWLLLKKLQVYSSTKLRKDIRQVCATNNAVNLTNKGPSEG